MLVSDMDSLHKSLVLSIGLELESPLSLTENVLFNDLIGRDVEHVPLDGNVRAHIVDLNLFLVVHKHHLCREVVIQLSGK